MRRDWTVDRSAPHAARRNQLLHTFPDTTLETNANSNVFDGCPTADDTKNSKNATAAGYAPNMNVTYTASTGPVCPSMPLGANAQNGLVFADLTVAYATQATPATGFGGTSPACLNTSTCGVAPSVWSFPNIGGLLIKDVAVVNGFDCIDAGFANFIKVEGPGAGSPGASTTEFECAGDFFAAHGGQGTIVIDKVSWKGGRGTGNLGTPLSQGVFMDYTDLNASRYLATANTTVTSISNSDLEGGAWGFLNFADANTIIGDTTISGTLCDGFTFSCYAFISVPGYTKNVGSSQHLSIDNTRWITSWYDAVYLDGGFYTGASGGATLSIGGNNLLAGSNIRDLGSAVTYLANRDLSMQYAGDDSGPYPTPMPTFNPNGFYGTAGSTDASAVQVVLNPASASIPSFPCAVVTIGPNDNVRNVVAKIPASCNSSEAGNANLFSTSLSTSLSHGMGITATVASTTGMEPGVSASVGAGTPNQETVSIITVLSSSQFTANFSNNHGSGETVQQFPAPPYQVTTTYAANSSYGFLQFLEWPNPFPTPPAVANIAPGPLNQGNPTVAENLDSYTVFTSQNIEPGPIPLPWMTAGPGSPCGPVPSGLAAVLPSGVSVPVYCQIGYLTYGASVKLTNDHRGIRVRGNSMTSSNGACVWLDPGTGRQLDLGNNYMGSGCAFPLVFPSPASSPPTDYNISANDMSNAGSGIFSPPQPFLNEPPAELSTARPGGGTGLNKLTGQISGNRGIFFIYPTIYNNFPVVLTTISSTSTPQTYYNLSPYNCVVNASNNGATIISTSIGPNPVPTGAPTPYPAFVSSFTLPPEGSFSYTFATGSTGSISVVETCSG